MAMANIAQEAATTAVQAPSPDAVIEMARIAQESATTAVNAAKIATRAADFLERLRRRCLDRLQEPEPGRPKKRARFDPEADQGGHPGPEEQQDDDEGDGCETASSSEFPRFLYSASHGNPVGVLFGDGRIEKPHHVDGDRKAGGSAPPRQ